MLYVSYVPAGLIHFISVVSWGFEEGGPSGPGDEDGGGHGDEVIEDDIERLCLWIVIDFNPVLVSLTKCLISKSSLCSENWIFKFKFGLSTNILYSWHSFWQQIKRNKEIC